MLTIRTRIPVEVPVPAEKPAGIAAPVHDAALEELIRRHQSDPPAAPQPRSAARPRSEEAPYALD